MTKSTNFIIMGAALFCLAFLVNFAFGQQQPPYSNQFPQPTQNPFPSQQQQQSNSTFMPLYNVSQVMACLHKSLADSMIKGAATGMLTIRNNTNGTVTGGVNEQFLTNATTNLDNCILPRR